MVDEGKIIEVCPLKTTETWEDVKISDELPKAYQNELKSFLEDQRD